MHRQAPDELVPEGTPSPAAGAADAAADGACGVGLADAPYRDRQRPIAARVADLLGRMTLAEKVAQLGSAWIFQLASGPQVDDARAGDLLRDGIGQITRIGGASSLRPAEVAGLANAIQQHLVTRTRLGIPAIVHEEICSGLMARDATVFPQALGLAATWQPELAEALADAVRVQMRAVGAHQGLSPVLDICRDPRWGRTEETFGEDPHLVAGMGLAFVRGLQGDDLACGVIATAKHFVGYGASEGGMNWAPAHIGERELRDVYLHPFEAAVRDAGLRSVMNAYGELDGVPVGADRRLLVDVLREEWGFDGCVVSDYFAVRQLADYHHVAADPTAAAAMALDAGIDVELPGTDCYGAPLLAAHAAGLIGEATIDTAVARVLTAKFELGLFEQPYVDVAGAAAAADTPAHRRLATTIAERSLVLLRNDGALPLTPGRIAVIGPNAATRRHLYGDYAYPAHIESLRDLLRSGNNVFAMPIDAVTLDAPDDDDTTGSVLDALRGWFGSDLVDFAPGCAVNDTDTSGFAEAVAVARAADVAVLVLGDKAGLTEDCTSGESRDTASLDLPGVQEELARAVLATGTPVVLVLVAGRPRGSAWLHEQCAAVLMAWLPGEQGGEAIAAALAGEVNPGGKLPITFPRSSGQIPVFYGHKISGGRSHWKGDYVDSPTAPLHPFGHGLSYTTFHLDDAGLRRDDSSPTTTATTPGTSIATVSPEATIVVDVTVTNTGTVAGDEVVQLYIRDPEASITQPVLRLTSFVRVGLDPGRSAHVTFHTPVAQLGFTGRDLDYVVEPGVLDVYVGTSSTQLVDAGSVTVVADDGPPPAKQFAGRVTVTPLPATTPAGTTPAGDRPVPSP